MKTGRNAPCPCGSGKKYKHCCLSRNSSWSRNQKLIFSSIVLLLIGVAILIVLTIRDFQPGQSGRVWSEEHQHWHTVP